MTQKAKELEATLAELPTADRAALAHFLIHSLEPTQEQDWDTAWEAELQRRADEIETGAAVGEPASNVFRELRAKYS
jgi:putative addiction module component (TIGR02574 family)